MINAMEEDVSEWHLSVVATLNWILLHKHCIYCRDWCWNKVDILWDVLLVVSGIWKFLSKMDTFQNYEHLQYDNSMILSNWMGYDHCKKYCIISLYKIFWLRRRFLFHKRDLNNKTFSNPNRKIRAKNYVHRNLRTTDHHGLHVRVSVVVIITRPKCIPTNVTFETIFIHVLTYTFRIFF